jgi:diguanylate cyclase (GGDEF)-like protein/PAS domain S-box-containing protein
MEKDIANKNHQELLFEVARKLLECESLQQAADILVKVLYTHIKSFDCAFFRFEKSHNQLLCISYINNSTSKVFKLKPIVLGTGVVGRAAEEQKTYIIEDRTQCSFWLEHIESSYSELSVPVIHKGDLIGVIDFEDENVGFFTEQHRSVIEEVARLIAPQLHQLIETERLESRVEQLKYQNKALKNNESRSRTILNNLPDPVFLLDKSCKILDINHSASLLLGASKSSLIGKRIQEFEQTTNGDSTLPFYKKSSLQSPTVEKVSYVPVAGQAKDFELAISRQFDDTFITTARELQAREDNFLQLKSSQDFLREVLKTTPDIVYAFDIEREDFILGRERLSRLLGYPENTFSNWRSFLPIVHPDDQHLLKERVLRIVNSAKGEVIFSEARLKHKSGKYRHIQNYAVAFRRADDGTPSSEIGTVRDVTERRELKAEVKRKEHYYRSLVENAFEGIALYDESGVLKFATASAHKLLGYREDEAIGLKGSEFIFPEDRIMAKKAWKKLMSKPGNVVRIPEYRIIKKSGEPIWVENTLVNLLHDENVKGVVSNFRDISLKKHSEMSLHKLSHFDELTELPNRNSLFKYLEQSLEGEIDSNDQLTLVYIDIVKLHLINSAHGNWVGDKVIQRVANSIEKYSKVFSFIARAGDDEFAGVLHNIDNQKVTKLVEDILLAYSNIVTIDGIDLKVTLRAGIVSSPDVSNSAEELLRAAENTVKQLKNSTKNYAFHEESVTVNSRERYQIEKDIIRAIELEQFKLAYQPVLSPYTGKIQYMESLLRWEHPERGYVPPDVIVDIAEETNLIHALTNWVLESAIKQVAQWKRQGHSLKVSINVSPKDLLRDDFLSVLESLLEKYDVTSNHIGVEVTETAAMIDLDKSKKLLEQLTNIGVTCALDDFGTGYSSISLLASLPVAKVKIDKSFITTLGEDGSLDGGVDNKVIVQNILRLAKSFKLYSVVEGVETMEQIKLLMEYGCDYVQGYLYSKPLFPEDLIKYLSNHKVNQIPD